MNLSSSSKNSTVDKDIRLVSRLWSNEDDMFLGVMKNLFTILILSLVSQKWFLSLIKCLQKKHLQVKNAYAYHTRSKSGSHSTAPWNCFVGMVAFEIAHFKGWKKLWLKCDSSLVVALFHLISWVLVLCSPMYFLYLFPFVEWIFWGAANDWKLWGANLVGISFAIVLLLHPNLA